VCGDGIKLSVEGCDDGNVVNGDGCSSVCSIEAFSTCNTTVSPNNCDVCGNTKVKGLEICDDGIRADGIGCTADCTGVLPTYVCTAGSTTTNSICSPKCGDSKMVGSETCDDGNSNNLDGCSSTCQIEEGYYCSGLPSVCYS